MLLAALLENGYPGARFPRGDEAQYRQVLLEDARRHAEVSRNHKAANTKVRHYRR